MLWSCSKDERDFIYIWKDEDRRMSKMRPVLKGKSISWPNLFSQSSPQNAKRQHSGGQYSNLAGYILAKGLNAYPYFGIEISI